MKLNLIFVLCYLSIVSGEGNDVVLEKLTEMQIHFYNNFNLGNKSSHCQNSIIKILDVLKSKNYEEIIQVLKFFDSSSKIPSGILESNIYDLGNFKECMKINLALDHEVLYGRYCLGALSTQIPIDSYSSRKKLLYKDSQTTNLTLVMSYCLPHTCSIEDFSTITSGFFNPYFCYTQIETRKLDGADITAIVILSIFLVLVIFSTAWDLVNQYYARRVNNNLLLAFSVWSNGKKILQINTNSDQLSCINGIRAISMMWVIYGHVNSTLLNTAAIDNIKDSQTFMYNAKNMYLMAAPVSVDTFLAVSGLLLMYVFLKSNQKGVRLNVPMFYLHRYLRLTPVLAVLVLFNSTLVRYLGSGPFWASIDGSIAACRKYWWSTLLYIQNFVNPDQICTGQSWYLSVDMQLFVLSPLILLLVPKYSKLGFITLGILVVAGILEPILLTYEMDLPASIASQDIESLNKYMKYYYVQTYSRFGPYVIGMIAGYILFNWQQTSQLETRRNKMVIIFLWIIAIGGLLACTYGGADVLTLKTTDMVSRTLYNGFNRNCWAMSVCLVVILCSLKCGGPINGFLSLPCFQLLSKLSYSMYLVHYTWVITVRLLNSKVLGHFEELNVIHNFLGDFIITLMVSFILCVVFESPMIIIEKAIFGARKNKDERNTPSNSA